MEGRLPGSRGLREKEMEKQSKRRRRGAPWHHTWHTVGLPSASAGLKESMQDRLGREGGVTGDRDRTGRGNWKRES